MMFPLMAQSRCLRSLLGVFQTGARVQGGEWGSSGRFFVDMLAPLPYTGPLRKRGLFVRIKILTEPLPQQSRNLGMEASLDYVSGSFIPGL